MYHVIGMYIRRSSFTHAYHILECSMQFFFFGWRCFHQLAVWSVLVGYSVLHSVSPVLPAGTLLLISFVYDKIIV